MSTPPWQDPPDEQSEQHPPPETPPWGGPPIPQSPYAYPSQQQSSNLLLYLIVVAIAIVVSGVLAALLIPGSPVAITGDDDDDEERETITQSEAAERVLRAAFECDYDYLRANLCEPLRSEIDDEDSCERVPVDRISCNSVPNASYDVECTVDFSGSTINFEMQMRGNDVCEAEVN